MNAPVWQDEPNAGIGDRVMDGLIERINGGDAELLERLILDYRPFILRCVSDFTGSWTDAADSDEYSIGLIAFHEAVRTYQPERGRQFIGHAGQVIRNRLIDHARRSKAERTVVPFSSVPATGGGESRFEDEMPDPARPFERVEQVDELKRFRETLMPFGVRFSDLPKVSPKHRDTRALCIRMARMVHARSDLLASFMKNKTVPIQALTGLTGVSRKTVERHRAFIVAVVLLLDSRLEIMKGYLDRTEREGEI